MVWRWPARGLICAAAFPPWYGTTPCILGLANKVFRLVAHFTVWYTSFSGMICRQLFSPDHFQKLFPTYLFQDKKKSHQKFVFITFCHLLWYLQGPPPGWQLKLQRESQEHTINQFSINMCEWKDMETTLHNHNKYFLQSYVYVKLVVS